MTSAALHSCLACHRHPSTHLTATPDSDAACPLCGLGDERETAATPPILHDNSPTGPEWLDHVPGWIDLEDIG